MAKTNRKPLKFLVNRHNKTRKIDYTLEGNDMILRKDCPVGLKSFEKRYQKEFKTNKLYDLSYKKFTKMLISKFSPSYIKPENDYYSYINYKWLQTVDVKKQQEYIVQIDDFRLTQDKVYHELNDIMVEYMKTKNSELSKVMKKFYDSVINMNSIVDSKIKAREQCDIIENLIKTGNPWKILAYIIKLTCIII